MASICPYQLKGGTRRYYVKYWSADHKQHKKEGFHTKREAEAYAAKMAASIADNNYVNPSYGRITIEKLGRKWLDGKKGVTKPKYFRDLEGAWATHVQPKWGTRRIASILHSEVQSWVSELGSQRSATVTLRAFGILKGIFENAYRDQIISRNPCEGVQLPRKTRKSRTYLTAVQVLDLAACSGRYSALILVLGFCGLRWGEAAALRIENVDFTNRKILVRASWVRSGSEFIEGLPKTWEIRDVPLPEPVAAALHEVCSGRDGNELVFTGPCEGHIKEQVSSYVARKDDAYQWFGKALKDAHCPRLTCHDLRHTAASIAISSGANVKAVQRMLGHKSAAMTLDVYADLFDSDLEMVAVNIGQKIDEAQKNRTKSVPNGEQ